MPILPMMNFQNIQPQGNPLAHDMFSNIQQGMQTAYMPANLAAALQKQQLANQYQQIQNQYAPQMSESEIAQKNAQSNLFGQQAQYWGPNAESEIGLRNAQTGLANQTMQYKPYEIASQMDPITKMLAGRQFAAQLGNRGGSGAQGSTGIPSNQQVSTGDSGMTITPAGNQMPVNNGNMSVMPGGLGAQMAPPIANTGGQRLPGGMNQQQGAQFLNGINGAPQDNPNVMNQGGNLGSLYDNLYGIQLNNALSSMGKNPAFGSNRAGEGGTYTDPMTGRKFTTNTGANTTTDQTTIAAVDRVSPIIKQLSNDLAPFQTLFGQANLRGQQLQNWLYGANNQLPSQYARGQAGMEVAAEGLLKAWGLKVTNEAQQSMKNAIQPVSGESSDGYKNRIIGTLKQLQENSDQASSRIASGQTVRGSQGGNNNSARVYNPDSGDIE